MVEEADLTFVGDGETYLNRVYSTVYPLEVEIPEVAREWLSINVKDKYLEITTQRNSSISPRSTVITLKVPGRSTTMQIKQSGLPTRKLPITSAVASSEQPDGPASWTIDGDYVSMWHSRYSTNSTQGQNHTISFSLEPGAENLDMIVLYPRTEPRKSNGRWGQYLIYVKGDGTDTNSTVPGNDDIWKENSLGSVDSEGYKLMYKGDETPYFALPHVSSIVLPVSVKNPTNVKIVIKGENYLDPNAGASVGGFAALAEIELFGKIN
ncbi:hypothetical protein EG339_11225 [Chryseobacterium bernardetii]|nr:hypothetical protein EG339_11225 [Chryseobacterium bernardetii]